MGLEFGDDGPEAGGVLGGEVGWDVEGCGCAEYLFGGKDAG